MTLNVDAAEPLLRQLIAPTRLRARLYLPGAPTRRAGHPPSAGAQCGAARSELPPLDTRSQIKNGSSGCMTASWACGPSRGWRPIRKAAATGTPISEVVTRVLAAPPPSAERVDDQNRLVLSVAVPIQRVRAVSGVLFVTTEGGDIDDILRQERFTLIEVFGGRLRW